MDAFVVLEVHVCTSYAPRRLSVVRPASDTLPLATLIFKEFFCLISICYQTIKRGSAKSVQEAGKEADKPIQIRITPKKGIIDPTMGLQQSKQENEGGVSSAP